MPKEPVSVFLVQLVEQRADSTYYLVGGDVWRWIRSPLPTFKRGETMAVDVVPRGIKARLVAGGVIDAGGNFRLSVGSPRGDRMQVVGHLLLNEDSQFSEIRKMFDYLTKHGLRIKDEVFCHAY